MVHPRKLGHKGSIQASFWLSLIPRINILGWKCLRAFRQDHHRFRHPRKLCWRWSLIGGINNKQHVIVADLYVLHLKVNKTLIWPDAMWALSMQLVLRVVMRYLNLSSIFILQVTWTISVSCFHKLPFTLALIVKDLSVALWRYFCFESRHWDLETSKPSFG